MFSWCSVVPPPPPPAQVLRKVDPREGDLGDAEDWGLGGHKAQYPVRQGAGQEVSEHIKGRKHKKHSQLPKNIILKKKQLIQYFLPDQQ